MYVFERGASEWHQVAKLVPSQPPSGWFGWSLAISDGVLGVGDPGSSAAVVFERRNGQWREVAVLRDTAGAFGSGVAIEGDTVVVGRILGGGAAVYQRRGQEWVEEGRITSAPEATGLLGDSVALSGDRVILGDYAAPVYTYAGRAHVFRRSVSDWIHEAKLQVSASTIGDRFGFAVDIEGTQCAVGAWRFGLGGNRGHRFELQAGNWVETAMLTAREHPSAANFGRTASCSGGCSSR